MRALPAFYDPKRVETLFHPDTAVIAEDAEASNLRWRAGVSTEAQAEW